ncbi:uncharacterized protein [Chironomus tepperi]|uniref:uncharacterized protein n=1 Tax=Chironomus tepperi TaxID=113505 RepID=UPI00391FA141
MAIPFYPDEEEASSEAQPAPIASALPTSMPHYNHNYSHLPQVPQIDNEALVQAFYEALCRCLQAQSPNSNQTTPMSTTNPFSREWHPSPHHSNASSTFSSVASSPRNSFRERHGYNSFENQQSDDNADDNVSIEYDEYMRYLEMGFYASHSETQQKPKSRKKPKGTYKLRLTNFVISALEFVIDTLK